MVRLDDRRGRLAGERITHVVFAVVIIMGALALWALHWIEEQRVRHEAHLAELNERYARVENMVTFESERKRLIGTLREEIQSVRPTLNADVAHEYARWAVRATEKYRDLDPAVLISVGIVESHYDAGAVSEAGARGLYQILPDTGRVLARSLGWEYTDELLYDAEKNTELAAYYLTRLSTDHDDMRVILAAYNGGPKNADHYRNGSQHLADETRDYVPKVLGVYHRIAQSVATDSEEVLVANATAPKEDSAEKSVDDD